MTNKLGRFERLELANKALLLNARVRVIEQLTGLTRRELEKVFYDRPQLHANHGRNADSVEWFLSANLIVAFHIASFYAIFRAILARGIAPEDSLVTAYQKYLARFSHDVRLEFDRAFLLVKMVDGHWTKAAPLLEAISCNDCHGLYIGALGDGKRCCGICPLCKTAKSFERSSRVSTALAHPALRNLLLQTHHLTA